MTTFVAPATVLDDALIEACGERAATYDRENRFFTEDFEALRAAGLPQRAGAARPGRRGPVSGRGVQRAGATRIPRSGDRGSDQHAPVLDWHRAFPARIRRLVAGVDPPRIA